MSGLAAVAAYYDPEEAYCAQGFLRANGIETITLQNDHHLTMAPWLRVALGGYRLLTRTEDAADAKALLGSVRAEREDNGATEQDDRPKRNWFWLPIAFFWAFPFVPDWGSGWVRTVRLVALVLTYPTILYFLYLWFPYFSSA